MNEQLFVVCRQVVALQQTSMSVPSHRAVHAPPSQKMPCPQEVFLQKAPPSAALVSTPLLHELSPVQRMSAVSPATATMRPLTQVFWS